MALTKSQTFIATHFKHAPTKEAQLKEAGQYILEYIKAYYEQWGWPTTASKILPRVKKLKAPLAETEELKQYLVDNKYMIISMGIDGRRYLFPGDIELNKQQINEALWNFHNKGKHRGGR